MRRLLPILLAVLTLGLASPDPAAAQYRYGTAYQGYTYTYFAPGNYGYGIGYNSPTYSAYPATTYTPYGSYGFPGNYYQPTYPSYMGYAPTVGATPAGVGTPVYSITYANPDGSTSTYAQSSVGDQPGLRLYYNAGYRGYSAPSPFYSYGQTIPPGPSPSYATYGPTTTMTSPNLGTYVSPGPSFSSGVAAGTGMSLPSLNSGTMGFGVGSANP